MKPGGISCVSPVGSAGGGWGADGWRGLGSGGPGGLRGHGLRLAKVTQCRCVGASGGERTAAQAHRGIVGDAGAGGAGKVVHGGLGGSDRDGGELGVGGVTRIERFEQLSRGVLVLVGGGAGLAASSVCITCAMKLGEG